MNIFRRRHEDLTDPEIKRLIREQSAESEKVLGQVRSALQRKDELLAEAINQTGTAVRRRRRTTA